MAIIVKLCPASAGGPGCRQLTDTGFPDIRGQCLGPHRFGGATVGDRLRFGWKTPAFARRALRPRPERSRFGDRPRRRSIALITLGTSLMTLAENSSNSPCMRRAAPRTNAGRAASMMLLPLRCAGGPRRAVAGRPGPAGSVGGETNQPYGYPASNSPSQPLRENTHRPRHQVMGVADDVPGPERGPAILPPPAARFRRLLQAAGRRRHPGPRPPAGR